MSPTETTHVELQRTWIEEPLQAANGHRAASDLGLAAPPPAEAWAATGRLIAARIYAGNSLLRQIDGIGLTTPGPAERFAETGELIAELIRRGNTLLGAMR
jgi:hypothetical protein